MTPVIIAFDRKLPFSAHQLGRRIAAHLVPSVLFTVAYMFVWAVMRTLLHLGTWAATTKMLMAAMRGMFLWSWLVYWLILSAWQIVRYYRHYAAAELHMERLQRQSSEAHLNALRMQLDPHFLFNTLNTISSQVERDPKLARRMIGHLGDLMRLSLECKDRQEVALSEEIAFLEHYLSIQEIRFGEHLRLKIGRFPRCPIRRCSFVDPSAPGRKCYPARHLAAGFRWRREGSCLERARARGDSRSG